jgi:hypothetical protein
MYGVTVSWFSISNGYHQAKATPCMFKNDNNTVFFSLVVDDFGIKYSNTEDVNHYISTLKSLYELKIDWQGSKYLGFTIKFDHDMLTVSLSMPDYVPKMLQRFYPDQILRGAASPAIYVPPVYGAKIHETTIDTSEVLSPNNITRLQEIIGSVLFYARAVDCTMLTAVNHLASLQANPTVAVLSAADRLM